MKTSQVSSIIIVLLILSCSEPSQDNNSPQTGDQEGFETVNFELKDSSILKMPYSGRTHVIFVDSLSNKLEFTIQENELETQSLSTYNENTGKCEPPSWTEQSKEILLYNDSLDLTFILELKTERDYSIAHNKKLSDKLILWSVSRTDNEEKDNTAFNDDRIHESRHALFQCVVDPRNSGHVSHWTPVDSTLVLGRTFYDVLGLDAYGAEAENEHSILFNFEYGILRFQDYENKYWRFSHFSN